VVLIALAQWALRAKQPKEYRSKAEVLERLTAIKNLQDVKPCLHTDDVLIRVC